MISYFFQGNKEDSDEMIGTPLPSEEVVLDQTSLKQTIKCLFRPSSFSISDAERFADVPLPQASFEFQRKCDIFCKNKHGGLLFFRSQSKTSSERFITSSEPSETNGLLSLRVRTKMRHLFELKCDICGKKKDKGHFCLKYPSLNALRLKECERSSKRTSSKRSSWNCLVQFWNASPVTQRRVTGEGVQNCTRNCSDQGICFKTSLKLYIESSSKCSSAELTGSYRNYVKLVHVCSFFA